MIDITDLTGLIHRISSILDPIGFAFEPIATNSDPDNDVDADYVIRLTFQVHRSGMDEKDGYYCAIFNAYVRLNKLNSCSHKHFVEMMKEFLLEGLKFRERLENSDVDVAIIGRRETIPSLNEVIANAEELLKATKH